MARKVQPREGTMRTASSIASLLLVASVASAASALAACDSTPEPAPDPIAGVWRISRTVHVTAGTNCPTMNAGDFRLVVSSGDVNEVTLVDNTLWADAPAPEITPTHVSFETEEYIFSENFNPVLIGHQLDVVGDQLIGTGSASGDGEYLQCQWQLDLVGTREDMGCKSGGGGCAL